VEASEQRYKFATSLRIGMTTMIRSVTPSFGELTAFSAAARHGSFSNAAIDLNLTQGAISRLIRQLEGKLQTHLFERVRQRVVLTDAGRAFALDVEDLLTRMSTATQRVRAAKAGRTPLNVVVLPSIGTLWLTPRLGRFLDAHPSIDINVSARLNPWDSTFGPFDAAIHYGAPVWAGAFVHHLMDEEVYPVCSPLYRAAHRIRKPEDLCKVRLVQLSTRPDAWASWFRKEGLNTQDAYAGATFSQFNMTLQAVIHDVGVALLPRFLIEQNLSNGTVIILFDRPLRNDKAYFVVVPETRAAFAEPFVEWMLKEHNNPEL
jgi:LysR family glycine cleavage system transcriptional activator